MSKKFASGCFWWKTYNNIPEKEPETNYLYSYATRNHLIGLFYPR
jgi:hypothetical protein